MSLLLKTTADNPDVLNGIIQQLIQNENFNDGKVLRFLQVFKSKSDQVRYWL